MSYEAILTSEDGGVGTVTLNRPERMNAWTPRMGLEVRHAIAAFDARDDIGVIIVTGAGRAFCAGADLDRTGPTVAELQEEFRPVNDRPYWEMGTPMIAAINGSAVGVGMSFPIQLDMRIVAERAKLGFIFARRGLLPELGSSWNLPRLVGTANALDMVLTGRIFDGNEAVRLGVASEAHPAEMVLERATEIARDIVKNVSPIAAALTKRLVYTSLQTLDRSSHAVFENDLFQWAMTRPDGIEGMASFMEKRDPEWKVGKNSEFPHELFEQFEN
jgi:enoyl-CoA hydratase/carnithine racemase